MEGLELQAKDLDGGKWGWVVVMGMSEKGTYGSLGVWEYGGMGVPNAHTPTQSNGAPIGRRTREVAHAACPA